MDDTTSDPATEVDGATDPGAATDSATTPRLVALEYVCDDDGPIIELFCDLMGFELVSCAPHPSLDADMTMIDAGVVMITVLRRTATGDRPQIPPASSALTQLVFDVEDGARADGDGRAFADLMERLVESGAPVLADSDRMFHLGAQLTSSVFGNAPTLVFHRGG